MAKDLNSHDVVNKHHQRNCFPRPPDPSTLRDIHLQQQCSNAREPHCGRSNNEVPRSSTSFPVDSQAPPVPPRAQTADVPPVDLEGPPTKLRAYPHNFRAVIECTKLIVQYNGASVDPFVTCSQFLDHRSTKIFNEALAETQNVLPGVTGVHK